MPLLYNPDGKLVCVTEEMANYWLEWLPEKKNHKGVRTRKGFRAPESQEAARDEYMKEVEAAKEKLEAEEAAKLAKDEASAFSIAKGLLKHVGVKDDDDKPKRGRKKKDD